MEATVLGACGAVGREVSRGLVESGMFEAVTLADLQQSRLRPLAAELGGNVATHNVRGSDVESLRKAIRGADLVANCTTYQLGVPALRAAIAEKTNYIDLGGLYNTPKQLEMDSRAKRAGVRAVIGCGATPGLTNVLVCRAAGMLDEVRSVDIAFASHRDIAPSPGLLDTLLDEFRPGVERFVWRDGGLQEVAPFDGAKRVRFSPPVGTQEVYFVPHSETHTLPKFLGNGVRSVAVRGTWRPEDMRTLRSLSELGLTSDRPIQVNGSKVRPLDVLRSVLLSNPPHLEEAPCAFFLEVEVEGEKDGKPATVQQRTSHPMEWGSDATARMTAVPAVVAAGILAENDGEPGVFAPEAAFEPKEFLSEVKKTGVRVSTSAPGPSR
ncbi:MAG: saccharopine dehydrogenase C-terminal domain-containing protein [Actinomycetota bacterium]